MSSAISRPLSGSARSEMARVTRSFPLPSVSARPTPHSPLSAFSSVTAKEYSGASWTASEPAPASSLKRASRVLISVITARFISSLLPNVDSPVPPHHSPGRCSQLQTGRDRKAGMCRHLRQRRLQDSSPEDECQSDTAPLRLDHFVQKSIAAAAASARRQDIQHLRERQRAHSQEPSPSLKR